MSDQTPTPRPLWLRLPPELRRMILEELYLLSHEQAEGDSLQRKRKRSGYVAVCREWQFFLEPFQFNIFTLHQSDLADFDKILQGHRRRSVKFIWLRLELPKYDCNSCGQQESLREVRINELLFTNAVWSLFSILSSWVKGGDSGSDGITLQLSAHSPSDALHYCQELKKRISYTGFWGLAPMKRNQILRNEDSHGWRRGRQIYPPRDEAKLRVFGHPRGLRFDFRASRARSLGSLPKVKVVNKLHIARQFYRHFSIPKALEPIIKSLPQLEKLVYEPWRGINTRRFSGPEIRDTQHTHLLQNVVRRHKCLRSISIFESFSGVIHGPGIKKPDVTLGRSFADASLNLSEMFAAVNVDAKDVFYAFWPVKNPRLAPSMTWSNMERICLSSGLLNPTHYNELIQVAASAALNMPKLRCMELWNCGMHSSCIFRYYECQKGQHIRKVRLLSTWHGKLSKSVVSRWREVADSAGDELNVKMDYLDYKVFDDYTAVIQYLFLRRELLTDFSLWQLVYQQHLDNPS
ncbi:hypothetical protein TrVFT333_004669 [Trichoderma virens FT-333]|nr:hypothetical protein TrVFT333_004669 [Trichoderma virens FT-333]